MSESPKLEVSFRSFKLVATEKYAIKAVKWPLGILIVAFACFLLIVALRSHLIDGLMSLISYFRR